MPTEILSKIFLILDPASMLAWKFTSRILNAATLTNDGKQLVHIQGYFDRDKESIEEGLASFHSGQDWYKHFKRPL